MPDLASRQPLEIGQAAIEEIRHLHNAILDHARGSLKNAIRIGEILTQVKGALSRGNWINWVESNCPFHRQTAWRYISCYERKDALECNTVLHLKEAYALIASCNGDGDRQPQSLHESNFWTTSIKLTQGLAGKINHEIKDRPIQFWGREKWVSLAAALEPLAELYSKLKSLIG